MRVRAVTYGNGHFVAVGNSVIITSANATNWSVSTNDSGNAVTYGSNMFVSMDSTVRPGTFVSTNNGNNWSLANSSSPPPYADGIAYGNGSFVAVGAGLVASSANASNWTVSSSAATTLPLTCGAYGPAIIAIGSNFIETNIFVAGGGTLGDTYGVIVTSINGTNWTPDTSPVTSNALLNTVPSGMVYGNGEFVGVGTKYAGTSTGVALTSYDGINWSSNTVLANGELFAIAYGPVSGVGTYVVLGSGGNLYFNGGILCGTNPATLNVAVSNLPLNGVVYGNSEFVGIGASGLSATSPDGVNWSTTSNGANTNLNAIAYGNNVFVAVGGERFDTDVIFSSPDGIIWTQRLQYSIANPYGALSNVTYGSGSFVAVGGGGAIFVSPDGTNWTQNPSGTVANLSGVLYGGGQFLALGAGGAIIGNTLSVPSTLTLGLPQVSSPGSLSFAFQTTPFCYHTVRQKADLNQPDWENTPTNSTLPVNPFFGTASPVQITLPISGSGAVFYNVNVSLGP